MILGCDAAGLDEDGNEVLVHAVISDPSWRGDETLDPKRSLLSERRQGTFAEHDRTDSQCRGQACRSVVRRGRVSADGVADGIPDAVHPVRLKQGDTVLVQGAGGGVPRRRSLARAAGFRV